MSTNHVPTNHPPTNRTAKDLQEAPMTQHRTPATHADFGLEWG